MKLVNKKLEINLEIPDLRQRHVEAFFRALEELDKDWRSQGAIIRGGLIARAAVEAGILPQMDVGEMFPQAVFWLGQRIDQIVGEAISIPPE